MVLEYHNNGLIMTIILLNKSVDLYYINGLFKNHCCDDIRDKHKDSGTSIIKYIHSKITWS